MNSSDRQLNRFDRQLWNRFVRIAQPYWYPTEQRGGWIFFGLLVLLLIFLFAALFVAVSAAVFFGQQFFPEFIKLTAPGLAKLVESVIESPAIYGVGLAILIPLFGFALCRNQLSSRWKQWTFLALLLLVSLSVNGLNVILSYVYRFIDTALAERQAETFWRFLLVFGGVFVFGTPIVAISSYIQQLLGLYWREWLTDNFLNKYFQNRAYYEINADDKIDNPDQRISEDIKSFTNTSLYFLLVILDSVITLIAFTVVLWSISQMLSIVLIAYTVLGTFVTAWIGKRLIGLNFNQLRREADFRYGLVHIRNNAESIAFYRGEQQESLQVRQRFFEALRNFNILIGWQRNLDFFTTAHSYFVRILPYMVVAPIYLAGQVDFGAITQALVAFTQIYSALAIVITQFERLSTFAAGINRLAIFKEALEAPTAVRKPAGATTIDTVEDSRLALEHVTLLTPNYGQTLVRDLSATVKSGEGLVIVGQSGTGKSSLLRAIAGLWNAGTGCIVRPHLEEMLFLPQRPYMILGSLRSQLLYPNTNKEVGEDELHQVLQLVNLASLPDRVGGFDVELNWSDVLSLGEQQRLAFARLLVTRPRYAILDEATSALDPKNEANLYRQLQSTATVFISVGHRPSLLQYHKYVLELEGDSNWRLTSVEDYVPNLGAFA